MTRYFSFTFYRFLPTWRALAESARRAAIGEFEAAIRAFADRVEVRTYSTVGLKRDCEFGTWAVGPDAVALNDFGAALANTALWAHVVTPHQFLSLTKPSPYANTA